MGKYQIFNGVFLWEDSVLSYTLTWVHRMSLKEEGIFMDLKQQLIHRKYKKCEAENQITIGDDYSVPEGKPDIASILQKKADLMVEEVHP